MRMMRNQTLGHIDFNDFNHLNPYNSRCRASDIDMVYEWKNHFLFIEWKRPGEELPRGQEILLQSLAKLPRTHVLLVIGHSDEQTYVENIWHVKNRYLLKGNGLRHLQGMIRTWHEHLGAR